MAENKAKLLEEQKKHIQKIKRENVKYALLSILGIFIFLLIWQLAVEFGLVNETRLPKPTTILQTLGYKIYNQAPDGNTLGINILASLQVALGNSWSTLVAAEMLAASAGLGYMIQIGRTIARPDIVIAGMVTIGAIGAVLSGILSYVEQHALRWQSKN